MHNAVYRFYQHAPSGLLLPFSSIHNLFSVFPEQTQPETF